MKRKELEAVSCAVQGAQNVLWALGGMGSKAQEADTRIVKMWFDLGSMCSVLWDMCKAAEAAELREGEEAEDNG